MEHLTQGFSYLDLLQFLDHLVPLALVVGYLFEDLIKPVCEPSARLQVLCHKLLTMSV